MTESLRVRRAVSEDAQAIAGFNQAMAAETEELALDLEVLLAGVRGLMTRPEHGFYLVAEAGKEKVGCLLVTYEWSDWRNGVIWWIQSVYVDAPWRRQGVYRRLYQAVKGLAAEQGGVKALRLYVEKDNRPAQRTYEALGMGETAYRIYEEAL